MKIILILFHGPDLNQPQDTDKNAQLYQYFTEQNIALCRAPITYYNTAKNEFSRAMFFENDQWVIKEHVRPHAIYDKSRYFITSDAMKTREIIAKKNPFANSLQISQLMSNKSLTYNLFGHISPRSLLIRSASDLAHINALTTEKLIIKPLSDSGGKGILITQKADAISTLSEMKVPILVQEFIDSSKTDNHIVHGRNDIRIIIKEKTPFYSFVRRPAQGKLLANISQGATLDVLPIATILDYAPIMDFLVPIIDKVDKYDPNHKFYAIDFMLDNANKPWLIELNSRPGILLEENELPYKELFYSNLLSFFTSIL